MSLQKNVKLSTYVNYYNIIHIANRNYTHIHKLYLRIMVPLGESFLKVFSEKHKATESYDNYWKGS